MSKRNRNKIQTPKSSFSLIPKSNPIASTFQTQQKVDPDTEMPSYIALNMLANGRGDVDGVGTILTRLQLGRLMAYMYFDNTIAQTITDIMVQYFAWMETVENDSNLRLNEYLVGMIGKTLPIIHDMQAKILPTEIKTVVDLFFKIHAITLNQAETNFVESCTWEQYKDFYSMTPSNIFNK